MLKARRVNLKSTFDQRGDRGGQEIRLQSGRSAGGKARLFARANKSLLKSEMSKGVRDKRTTPFRAREGWGKKVRNQKAISTV